MNKAELIKQIQSIGEYQNKKDAERALDSVFGTIEEAMKVNDTVSIPGFGIFGTKYLKGKSGIVPGTNREYQTDDKMVPIFRASLTLKEVISKNKIAKK